MSVNYLRIASHSIFLEIFPKTLSVFLALLFFIFLLFVSKKLFHKKHFHCRYLTHTLDMFVEQDYSLVYFHYGLTSKNKPPLSWLWQAYKAFDRKYKKNLKALYLVHPTNFIRIVWQIFKPAIRYTIFLFLNKRIYIFFSQVITYHINLNIFLQCKIWTKNDVC